MLSLGGHSLAEVGLSVEIVKSLLLALSIPVRRNMTACLIPSGMMSQWLSGSYRGCWGFGGYWDLMDLRNPGLECPRNPEDRAQNRSWLLYIKFHIHLQLYRLEMEDQRQTANC
jgi:hypothetical protein